MATLTDNERRDILAQYRSAMDEATRELATTALWDKYKGTAKEQDAHTYVNSVAQLFRLVTPGTELACVYLKSNDTPNGNANRHWKVFVGAVFDGRMQVVPISGYMRVVGIGRKSQTDELTIVTNAYASDLALHLGYFLYGYDRTDWLSYRTF